MSTLKDEGNAPDIALLIIDMQKSCRASCKAKEAFDSAVEYINIASSMFRENGAPVVIVQDRGEGAGPGTDFDVVDAVVRADTDIVIHKDYNNSFCGTGLADILREKGVRFVVVSGFAAEYCVEFSYNGAVENGFNVSLLQNGVAGDTEEGIRFVTRLRPMVSLRALNYMLG